MGSWRREYLAALENRDRHEQADVDIYNAYTNLADKARHHHSTLDTVEASPPDTLAILRHDLVEAQRSKAELHVNLKVVTDELQKLSIRSKAESKRINELVAEKAVLTTRLKDRDDELKGKAKLLENVQDEMVSLNLQLNMAEERTKKLQRENKDLVDRWMARMGLEADAMNNASKYS
ncbi:hypothetical protein MMC16_002721 [Acarospora aff. strigata]|nr:hypothetical protein [Acarospora aff. strigata]